MASNDKPPPKSVTPRKPGAAAKFVPDTRTVSGRGGNEPPAWAIVTMVAVIGLVILLFSVPDIAYAVFPFARSDYFWIGLIFLPMVALLVLAAASKGIEFRKAKSWTQTTGTIVRSEIEARRHRFEGEAEKVENVPAVEYEFTAGGRKYRGSRIGIGDDAGGANTQATLVRYPHGASVAVFYDPADPRNCVLERGGPFAAHEPPVNEAAPASATEKAAPGAGAKPSVTGCLGGLALLALFGGAIWWLIARGPAFIAARFPNADAPVAIFAACFGLAALAMCLAMYRYSRQAQSWPSVRGTIIKSEVESYREQSDGRTRTLHRPAVEFAYTVHGREYRGNQIKLMVETGGSQASAAKVVAKYPEGGAVDVHYDPANPGTAALENPTGMSWLVLALALGCFALAAWQLGIFR